MKNQEKVEVKNKQSDKKDKSDLKNKDSKDNKAIKWVITVSIITFLLSLLFSFISNVAINGLAIVPAIFILVLVIFVGIAFDLIGVAVTVANEGEFHAMAAKKIHGSKEAIKLIRNSPRVSNFCADVIGDICGVLSGSLSAMITLKLTESYGISSDIQVLISAIVAAATVGGKAITKEIAKKHPTQIVFIVSKLLSRK